MKEVKRKKFKKKLVKYVDMDMIELYEYLDTLPEEESDKIKKGIMKIEIMREKAKRKIVTGVKFICEHQGLSREELVEELAKMGCDYDISDIKYFAKLFNERADEPIKDSIKNNRICSAVSVIANIKDSEYGYDYCKNNLLQEDDSSSLYHYVRKVGNDPEYKMKAIKRFKKLVLETAKTELMREKEKITIINGLKYFSENKLTTYEKFIKGLDELGCTYTRDDIERISDLFKENYDGNKWDGMRKGLFSAAVEVIASARSSELSMYHIEDGFLTSDDDKSIYHFIRKVTGDEGYKSQTLKHR